MKLALAHRAPKTVNNVLTVLSTLLKKAVEWGELERLPCASVRAAVDGGQEARCGDLPDGVVGR